MSKRMGYSVVGLPHYTIWHLYEPSVDDIRHMEEMERERIEKEKREKEEKERLKKIQEEFQSSDEQWKEDLAIIKEAAKAAEQNDGAKE